MIHINSNGDIEYDNSDRVFLVKTSKEWKCNICGGIIPKGSYKVVNGCGFSGEIIRCVSCFKNKTIPNLRNNLKKLFQLYTGLMEKIEKDKKVMTEIALRSL